MSGFYRIGKPGEDIVAHINTGRKKTGARCASPRFDLDNPAHGELCGRISAALCDYPLDSFPSHNTLLTCDRPMCEDHRTKHKTKPNTDYCTLHASEADK